MNPKQWFSIVLFIGVLCGDGIAKQWQEVYPEIPLGRQNHAMVYHEKMDKVFLFGGYSLWLAGENDAKTWTWDGVRWSVIAKDGPGVRWGHSMAYDSQRNRVVLFGGTIGENDTTVQITDTWEWDGSKWMKIPTVQHPHVNGPMAYDKARKMTVMLTPHPDDINKNQTWGWNGTQWSLLRTDEDSKGYGHNTMVYDEAREVIVLHGGSYGDHQSSRETWEWNGETWSVAQSGGAPKIIQHIMAYDSKRERVVMFGGYTYGDATWEWDGTQWYEIKGPVPDSGRWSFAVYDKAREETILFGGHVFPNHASNTWGWDGTSWYLKQAHPRQFHFHSMTYDAENESVLMNGETSWDSTNETWCWDGKTWSHYEQENNSGLHGETALAYDSKNNEALMFGGVNREAADTSRMNSDRFYRLKNQQWELIDVTGPSGRSGHSMAYDPKREVVVLHGGYNGGYEIVKKIRPMQTIEDTILRDTWEWNGIEWKQVSSDGPSPARHAEMVYDKAREEIVLLGGVEHYGFYENTTIHTRKVWSWNGTRWMEIETENFPELYALNASYDSSLQRIIVMGLNRDREMELWILNDRKWKKIGTQDTFVSGGNQLAYDWKRQTHVLFNGTFTYEFDSDILMEYTAVDDWRRY